MASDSDRAGSLPAEYVRDAVTLARYFLTEVDRQAAESDPETGLHDLPGYPAEFDTGRLLGWQAMLSLCLTFGEQSLRSMRSGEIMPEDLSVGMTWLRNLILEFNRRWLRESGDTSPFTFVGCLIWCPEEAPVEADGMLLTADVLTVAESDDRPRPEAFERRVREMQARWVSAPPTWHIGFVLTPAEVGDLAALSGAADRLRGEDWCLVGFPYKRRLAVGERERDALYRAVELLASTLDGEDEEGNASGDGSAPPLPAGILGPGTDPANMEPMFFRRVGFIRDDDFDKLKQTMERLDNDPALASAYHAHLLKQSHGFGKPGRNPSPQSVGEILGRAEDLIRAVESCIPIEDEPDCDALLHEFPWHDGEFLVCRAASDLSDALIGDTADQLGDGAQSAYGWPVETTLGLRWLSAQLNALLDKWRVTEWERRLREMRSEPQFRATITRAEIQALKRAVERIRTGLAQDDSAAGPTQRPVAGCPPTGTSAPAVNSPGTGTMAAGSPAPTKNPATAQKRALIVAAYYESRGTATNAEIAEEVGANEGYVSRVLKPIRDSLSGSNRESTPRGRKAKDGAIEAWGA